MFVWRVQIFYHIFLSTVYHSFSSAFHHSFSFIPHIHTHSYLHFPPSYTHTHIHINFITKICKFPMNTLLSHTSSFLFYCPRITTSFCSICKLSCGILSSFNISQSSVTIHKHHSSASSFPLHKNKRYVPFSRR